MFFFMAGVYDRVYNLSQRGRYRIKSCAVLKELGLHKAKRNTGAITGSSIQELETCSYKFRTGEVTQRLGTLASAGEDLQVGV